MPPLLLHVHTAAALPLPVEKLSQSTSSPSGCYYSAQKLEGEGGGGMVTYVSRTIKYKCCRNLYLYLQAVDLMFSPGIINYIHGFKIKSTEKIFKLWNYSAE